MALPRFVVLKSDYNNKYLRYIEADVEVYGFLQFTEEKVMSPYAKFEVVMAKRGKGLVNIRCCYNKKYWVRWSENHYWIVAGADEPEEDKSKWSCTLFEPIYVDAKTIRFRHVQLGHYACLWRMGEGNIYDLCLFAGSNAHDRDHCDVCTIIDWESLSFKNMYIVRNFLKILSGRSCRSRPWSRRPSPPTALRDETSKVALPRFVVLKSIYNGKYLHYVKEDVQMHGFLQFSGDEVVSPYAKYEVEMAKSGRGLVNIRCCYNNKYWVRRPQNPYWIVAEADEPEEDISKWSCTLFDPICVDATTIRFRHVQLGHYTCLWRTGDMYDSCLFAGSNVPDRDQCDVCTIIDWESLLILPKHVAFKGDNGYYLSSRMIEGYPYLQFASNDIGDPTVGNEVFTTCDGSVRIKSNYFGKFWRRSPNWIWADSDETSSNNSDTLFWPIKVDNRVIALRNLENNKFCKRLSTEGKTDCLNAAISTISREARLEVEELVLSRTIYNVNYRLMDARIYNQSVLTMANGNAINRTQEPSTVEVKLQYTERRSKTWNASVSLKLGIKASIQTGVPLIADGKIEIQAEFKGEYQWGQTDESSTVVETAYTVTVPPMTMVKVSLLATKGSCDVPFSYSQRDTLINGQQIASTIDDGVYTGINCYNFQYETGQVGTQPRLTRHTYRAGSDGGGPDP
ncbi:hypothetical protein F0562_019734 [Nyssa sinensis]|uniref:Agglutinin domain-containing protein n=1 Tax=Nyssa sinensis TaxID=561372 RepID=A0A5J5BUB9_9ASTE|nr:hypothetical protein F0562_019734 [Nyssa sinensis]